MIGTITLVKGSKGTEQFLTIGYYDTESELLDAVEQLSNTFAKMNILQDVNYYISKDYIHYYIKLR